MVKIKIYTKKNCPFCHGAKSLFEGLKLKYEEIQINSNEDMLKLSKKTKMMSVLQIFINEKLIGGYDDLFALKDSGELNKLIK